jgi:hypothetical protein
MLVAWHWDSERGRRVRARGPLAAWVGRRDPFFFGPFVGIVVVLGLVVAGGPVFLVGFGGLFAATAAASLVVGEGVLAGVSDAAREIFP